MATRTLILSLAFTALLLFHAVTDAVDPKKPPEEDLDEDLSFLEEDESAAKHAPSDHDDAFEEDDEDLEGMGDFDPEAYAGHDHDHHHSVPEIDETDVVVLTEKNFSGFIEKNRHVLVEFYAPWCGHCQALAPEYAAAATALKGEEVSLAKVDASEEGELAQKYEIQGFPTVLFFIDGVHKPYPGQRNKEAIVTWIKKKIGPSIINITTTEDAEKILTAENKLVLGFLDSLVGPDSQELSAASKLEEDVTFYQTTSSDVAQLFHIDAKAKRPLLVLLKRETEKINFFDGKFDRAEIADFVFSNKLPLVTTFTRESAPLIFENPIKNQLLLFASSKDSEKVLPSFEEAAKIFKGKLIFVYVELDNEDVGKPVSEYFGVTGEGPKVLAYTGNDDAKKYILDGEVTTDTVKAFAQNFLVDKLKPFYKSDPIPETNDGDVKIVVGNNFDEIVLDESKDVLLEIYAPWCGHCQALEPTYNKLAKHLRGIESLVIAKMDGTTNEHPRAKITVDTDRTVVAFYKFLKKNAAIPFKLQKPASAAQSEGTAAASESSAKEDLKDEL
ncbi:Protein disulfide isomerase-like 1-4 [Acorus gramineus]|uniref:Protein disulfide-isomerase n=1 Tax=Acorus gramineus TaxID=55184 RepID=A0AAV9A8X3_ACOGR|nr:Protein disulfide isomerase-like 1-4 [Acorus gramineus]